MLRKQYKNTNLALLLQFHLIRLVLEKKDETIAVTYWENKIDFIILIARIISTSDSISIKNQLT